MEYSLSFYISRRRRTAERTEAAAVVEYTQAPPATTRLHRLQDQIPTQERFIASWNVEKWNQYPPNRMKLGRGSYLSAECAGVLCVLGDFHFLHHLTQGGTISGTIFTDDSDFPGALGLSK